jgi:2-oxoglutarate dehydrogenase E2 component (dihydrolipoamide succinyltransferase)
MSVNIVVPSFGESITEGTIAQWLKKEGDFVSQDEIILEIESEKATQGIPSPAAGVLHIAAKQGDKVEVGAVLGNIDESAEPPKTTANPAENAAPDKKPAPPPSAAPAKEAKLSPAARRVAAEEHVELSKVKPTGRNDVILKEDVQKIAVKPTDGRGASLGLSEKRVPMTAIRQRIADRLLTSQKSTASLTTFNEIDMSAVMELRARYKEPFKSKYGVNLGFLSFFVKAAVEALRSFPLANAAIDGRDIVYHGACNISVAVSTDQGLMVPVLRGAQDLTFADIEKAVAELAVKARDGKITIADLQGGTFTITNGGIFGSMLSTPILNFPQSAILGMHAIQKRPVVREDQIVIRPMMYVALTYDHRLLDGREAVLFLVRIKECIEDPERMLLEI